MFTSIAMPLGQAWVCPEEVHGKSSYSAAFKLDRLVTVKLYGAVTELS